MDTPPAGGRSEVPDARDHRLAMIAEATSVQVGQRPISETADAIIEKVWSGFACDAVVARLLEEDRLVLLASRGVPGKQLVRSMPADGGIALGMITTREAFQIPDVPQHNLTGEKYRVSPNAFRFRSFCGAPMVVSDRVVGILGLYSVDQPDAFSDADVRDLQIVANHIAAAIANTQLYDRLVKLNVELEERVMERTAALSRTEASLGLLAEHAIDVISQHSLDGRFVYVSPAATRELGWDPEDLLGKLPREFVHPDDRDAVISARAELLSSGSRAVRREYRFRTRNGTYRWVESASRRLKNQQGGVVVVTRDITPRREAQQRLRLVQAAVAEVEEGVVITDAMLDEPGPRILYVNPAFTDMSGYSAREIEGLSPRVLQGEETDRGMLRRLRETLEAGQPFAAETVNYRKDGTPYHVEWNIAPVRQPNGQITHWVSVQRDITGRLKAEQLERLHRDELAHATRLNTMGELASGLAHELNQPLAAIANYAAGGLNRLQDAADDGSGAALQTAEDALGRIKEQATRAGAIIRRLRAFVTRRTSQRADADLSELVREVMALNEADSRTQEVALTLELSSSLPRCRLDVIQIEQVILNLIRNALDAVADQPEGRRRVRVATWATWVEAEYPRTEAGQAVFLEVSDTGEGLDDEQLRHLFDPFFTTKAEGMGLGLTISESIVEAHEGRLRAQRNAEDGLTVRMRLPACGGEPRRDGP